MGYEIKDICFTVDIRMITFMISKPPIVTCALSGE